MKLATLSGFSSGFSALFQPIHRCQLVIANIVLVNQANLIEKCFDLTVNDFFRDILWFTLHLTFSDLTLMSDELSRTVSMKRILERLQQCA